MNVIFSSSERPDEVTLQMEKLPAGFGCEALWYSETPITEAQWMDVMGKGLEVGRGLRWERITPK